jgi:phage tail sheath protein FI
MVYDRYNDKNRWVNTAGSSAGLRAYISNSHEPWTSSAGLNNGVYRGVLKIAQSFNLGQRDLLFKNAINVTTSFPGSGITLFGDKTLIQKESAFNAVGVRCLFNYAERATAKMAKYVLFEQNTATTRNLFVSSLKPFYERMVAKGGLEDFRLIADESNNTPLMRQNKTFVCDIYLKPTGVIWFAKLTFVNVGLSVSFSEVIGTV